MWLVYNTNLVLNYCTLMDIIRTAISKSITTFPGSHLIANFRRFDTQPPQILYLLKKIANFLGSDACSIIESEMRRQIINSGSYNVDPQSKMV